MKRRTENIAFYTCGFSLTELLAAMVIGAMVMITSIGVYSRMRRSAVTACRRYAIREAIPALKKMVEADRDGGVRREAKQTLAELVPVK